MKEVALGIDIGGTNTKFGFVDRDGNMYGETSISTVKTPPGDVDAYLKYIHEEVEALRGQIPEQLNIVGVGIGAPNGNYFTGTIEYAPNLSFRGIVPLVKLFQKYYNVPMVMTNDANAAAIGEMIYGGAKGMKNFIMITLGTGLGSGFVANGELIYGNDGFAGEMGHLLQDPKGRVCGLGRRGCLEGYVSATGIKRTVFTLLGEMIEDSPLRDVTFNQLTASMITDLAKEGDPIALAAFDQTCDLLGQKLADATAIFSPEAIFLLGGLAKAGKELLFDPTKKYMEHYMFQVFKNKVELFPSALEHRNAAVLGASALAWKEMGINVD
ncbi:glucokinase [Catalinimonas alkaloidigena]|uniref:ROK family protein n=1 Tax=Catalinimonas alkaloidigena TaxID=1075417 RepID=UPI0024069FFD|nr:ROK family protein [Catalinimonas alkaloidigena]MDF9800108.1 glucokinase [Catalinimonas alkaloidigena]